MTKFEYSDFYKFIASAGIALITLAVFVPWLFLREPFDLFQTTKGISQLTPMAQDIIAARQASIQSIINIIPIFSAISFVLGFLGLIVGSVMWYRKTQLPIDKLAELNIKTLEKQLAVSSPEEVKVQREEEIIAQLEVESPADFERESTSELDEILVPDNINNMVESSIRIERRVTGLLVSCFSETHTIFPERRLGPIAFDVVMASKTSKPDYIFEIKYIRKGFKYNWLRDNVQKILYANRSYEQETNRKAIPVLLIVGNENMTPSPTLLEKYINRVQDEMISLNSQVLVVFIPELEFYNMDCTKLKSKLNV
jgi:hypothetical protein